MQGAQVWSLAGELRSCMLHGMAKNEWGGGELKCSLTTSEKDKWLLMQHGSGREPCILTKSLPSKVEKAFSSSSIQEILGNNNEGLILLVQ